MPDGLKINADDYAAFFAKTNGLDRKLKLRVRRRIRESARKIAPKVIAEGAEPLPSGGGLNANVAAKGRNPTVRQNAAGALVVLGRKKGPQIGRMNAGQLRHPVFGTRKWVEQTIPAGTWTKAIKDHEPEIQTAVRKEMLAILKELG